VASHGHQGRTTAYVNEHRDLIQAILNDTPLNEGRQVADSTATAILGREAAYSGSEVDWGNYAELEVHLRSRNAL